ncbi:MAG TPA: tetratricopeptide repeat protein [Nitrospira sp.]|nr:tetratricopeptide repeat protein [Nitrospira sp.]
MKKYSFLLVLCSAVALAEAPETVRICDQSGCSERPRNATTFNPAVVVDPVTEQRTAKLIELAEKEPRAAYDLGLRYFRGDGVRQDSYQALKWMRDAGERGFVKAQTAVGRFYLMGLEEMGSDPAEAEKWLSMAAGRGDKEARKLLAQATKARQNDMAYRRWVDSQKAVWNSYWMDRYQYEWQWRNGGWVDYGYGRYGQGYYRDRGY